MSDLFTAPLPSDPLEALNPKQRAAATAGIADGAPPGPLLVIAGAGTGKTHTLAHRVAQLLRHGASPEQILLLTFSRRAADEMARRVQRIVAQSGRSAATLAAAGFPWAGTFHSVGARLLREYAGVIGLDPSFTIHDREDSADLMNLVRHERGLSAKARRFPLKGTCLAIYSAVVNTQAVLADVLRTGFPWCAEWEDELKALFAAYVDAKQAQQVLDYDDLLLYWSHMAAEPSIGRELGERFRHVLVDEYQDTNRLQASLLYAMKPDGRGLTVVGDDAQSIYAFRGATVRNILDFPARFDPPAQRVVLEQNYRSTPALLDAANAVIGLAEEGFGKTLWSARDGSQKPELVSVRDDADQAAFVIERILARRETGTRLRSQAVLFRTASHSMRLEIELARRNIPFVKYGGLKFLEAAHVKDLLSILRWAQNLRDRVSGFRALQLLQGLGPKTAARILDNVSTAPPGAELLREQPVPEAVRCAWTDFATVVESIGDEACAWPQCAEQAASWYLAQMDRLYEDAAARAADIQQLARLAVSYPGRERFLTELTLDPPEVTSDEPGAPLLDEDYLILSTIHSAKGREWSAVSVLNVVDGCIPSEMSTGSQTEIEEERRLLYVAMTRARDQLELVMPQRFYLTAQSPHGDRHVYAGRTRFIPNRLLDRFGQTSWPVVEPAQRSGLTVEQARLDLAERMRSMWR
ncbi:ATP-dependent helicase [Methyloversatilis thermotolerans]|uniref:ATP-dependent helicase n=1 Tax=Methyloversatilis thermotolerans TaxID=1346290 RepID=UPI000365AB6E|nr:ATP-dependent helicase [Methyloversatilis thermotolerans]